MVDQMIFFGPVFKSALVMMMIAFIITLGEIM